MSSLPDLIPLLSAFGLGAIFQAVIQHWLSTRKYVRERAFTEKKEAYVGFLLAIHESEIKGTLDAAKNVGHWGSVCELFAAPAVVAAIAAIAETNPINGEVHPGRPAALARLKAQMKSDLERT